MLKEITSLWDYFKKAEADKQYELVGIYSYIEDGYNPAPYTFDSVKAWIEKWVHDTVNQGYEQTCRGMVDYLNRTIRRMDDPGHAARLQRKLANAIAIYEEQQAYQKNEMERLERARQQAQATGQPVITAQQTPAEPGVIRPGVHINQVDWTQIVNTTPIFQTTNYTINPAYYGTITIDNTVRQTRPNPINPPPMPEPPTAITPQPPVENLWGDIPEPLPAGVPPAEHNTFIPTAGHPGNPTGGELQRPPLPGEMTEYGWYDQDIETEIQMLQAAHNLPREDAVIRVFNNAGPDHPLRNPPPPTPPAANEPQWADLGDDFNLDEIIIDYPDDDPREER